MQRRGRSIVKFHEDMNDPSGWTNVGRPAFFQASKPPMMSVAFNKPISCSATAARLLARPSWSKTMILKSNRSAMDKRSSMLRGSNLNSRSVRATTRESGTSPCN